MKILQHINKYDITIESKGEGDVEVKDVIKECLLRNVENRKKLKQLFGEYFRFFNGCIYSTFKTFDKHTFNHNHILEEGGVLDLKVHIEISNTEVEKIDPVTNNNLLGYLIRNLLKMLKFQQVGRKLFNPAKSVSMDMFALWPGYSTSLIQSGQSKLNLLNIDMTTKVITETNVLSFMGKLRRQAGNNFEAIISVELEGKSVMTKYNNRIYRVDEVDFKMTPASTFTKNDGTVISFSDYYQNQYKTTITKMNQPLLVHKSKKRGELEKTIYLIPELCVMTGLTDEQRGNRKLMSRLDKHIKPAAGLRLKRCTGLAQDFKANNDTKKLMEEWSLQIENTPLKVKADHLFPGKLLFSNKNIDIEKCSNLDRESQNPMHTSKDFNKLVVFYPTRSKRDYDTFASHFKTALNQYKMKFQEYKEVAIEDFRKMAEIKKAAKQYLNPQVTCCIWILPGRKKAGINYDNIKRMLINEMPVPSQMILASTISAGKNLRSIITKMLVQIGAKIGAVPWAINDLPFVDKPTMIIGLDTYSKNLGGKSHPVMALVATNNHTYSTYFSDVAFARNDYKMDNFLKDTIPKAIEKFIKDNGIHPMRIIVFREGISSGQRKDVLATECVELKNICEGYRKQEKMMSYVYVTVNKTNNAKFFRCTDNNKLNFDRMENPKQGSCIYEDVCDSDEEFYLVSQKSFRGLATPTHYFVLSNELGCIENMTMAEVRNLIATLSFKLSFMYYNTIGAIKVPAPIHYANKLSNFVGDRSEANDKIVPHNHWMNLNSLYFI